MNEYTRSRDPLFILKLWLINVSTVNLSQAYCTAATIERFQMTFSPAFSSSLFPSSLSFVGPNCYCSLLSDPIILVPTNTVRSIVFVGTFQNTECLCQTKWRLSNWLDKSQEHIVFCSCGPWNSCKNNRNATRDSHVFLPSNCLSGLTTADI